MKDHKMFGELFKVFAEILKFLLEVKKEFKDWLRKRRVTKNIVLKICSAIEGLEVSPFLSPSISPGFRKRTLEERNLLKQNVDKIACLLAEDQRYLIENENYELVQLIELLEGHCQDLQKYLNESLTNSMSSERVHDIQKYSEIVNSMKEIAVRLKKLKT